MLKAFQKTAFWHVKICIVALLAFLCFGGTGCIRLLSDSSNNMLNGDVLPNSSQVVTKEYFTGTKLVVPVLSTRYFPLALLDLPFEFVFDVCIMPFQFINNRHAARENRLTEERNKQMALKSIPLAQLINDGNIEEIRRRVKCQQDFYVLPSEIIPLLVWKNDDDKKRLKPIIDVLFKYEDRYPKYMMMDENAQQYKYLGLYQYLFKKKLLVPSRYPNECVIYNAMVHARFNSGGDNHQLINQMDLVKLFLKNSCNPNGRPGNLFQTPLDIAMDDWKICMKNDDVDARKLNAFINLLKSYGANAKEELKQKR